MLSGCIARQKAQPDPSTAITNGRGDPASKTIEINVAWQYIKDSQQQVWFKYIFEPFTTKHPEVKVNFRTYPDWQTSVRIQIEAGAGPDMFYMDSFDVPYYATRNQVLNLENYRAQYNLDQVMYDWAIRATLFNGQMYALPQSVEATALTYNKTLLNRLGHEVPRTREEYVALCESALDANLIPVSFGYQGVNILLNWYVEHYLTAYCGADVIREMLQGTRPFNDSEIRGAFELMKADWDAGYIGGRRSAATPLNEAREQFTSQQAVMNFEGAWLTLVDTAPGTWKFDWGQTIWPSMRDGVPAASAISLGEAIGISPTSKNADLCVEMMMDYYLDEKVAAQVVASGFSTPARPIDPSLFPDDMPDDIKKALDAQTYNMNQPGTGYAPWGFFPARLNEYILTNFEKLLYNQMSLDDFMARGQPVLEQDFAEGFVFAG
ncbi:MAG: extracellular solute-binding protein [Eubacteriales bacterium]|nr:extracellular solute-binding protein [Eubacteriales bacterium]